MEYTEFKDKLIHRVFGDNLNKEILMTVLQNPKRYIGIFRVTNAKTKLIQNVTQSCEIKFGDFMEEILTHYINEMGYINLDKNIGYDNDGNKLNADQIFTKGQVMYLIEQKIRDDHDSTKKRGQFANLLKKIDLLKLTYPNQRIVASMWFSDESLQKNKRYYLDQIKNICHDNIKINLFYGQAIFESLFNRLDVWQEITMHLKQNKQERSKEILQISDFDTSPEMREALLQINKECPTLIKKLLSDTQEYRELREELFPTKFNLKGF